MLVIFDCDGVLVDSEKLAAEVFSSCLAEENILLDSQQCFDVFRGHTLSYCFSWLRENQKQPLSGNFAEKLAQSTRSNFEKNLRPVPGVLQLVELLKMKKVPYCVASNGERDKIEHSLKVTGLLPLFVDKKFSREDVARGKPAPDLFLYAAKAMGVSPVKTTVIEDSSAGVTAALAAGMNVIFYNAWKSNARKSKVEFPARVQECLTMRDVADKLSLQVEWDA